MMGECNCACMLVLVQNLFGRVGFFLSASPVFCSVVSYSFFGFPTSLFPNTTQFLWLSFTLLNFCVVLLRCCVCLFL